MSTKKDNKGMCSEETKKKIFFVSISTFLLTAATFELYSVYHLKDQCPQLKLDTAPKIAGVTLLGTFMLSALWAWAVKNEKKALKQVSIILWTAAMVIGIAAAGATLGQIELYGTVCAALKDIDFPFRGLQYISIACLVAYVAMSHVWPQEKNNEARPTLVARVVDQNAGLIKRSPLVFL